MNSPSLPRRFFLKKMAAAAGFAAAGGLRGSAAQPEAGDRSLRDRLWMWGHDAGSLKNTYGFGSGGGTIMPGEALKYMGIPNVCMVRFTGTPHPPFDDYARQFASAKRLAWSFVDGDRGLTTEQKRRLALGLAEKMPNLVTLVMDDFFLGDAAPKTPGGEAPAHLSIEELKRVRNELVVGNRKLELSLVLYSNQVRPEIAGHLSLVDCVYFWTWKARDLEHLEDNFAAYRKIAPGKRTLLGIYMWDFGEKRPISLAMMEHQCRLGLEWLKRGEIEGLIFHCTPLCDMKLEAVEWARKWIAEQCAA